MAEQEELQTIVRDLIDVMIQQSKELEQLMTHVERSTASLPYRSQLTTIHSELSALRQRVTALCHQQSMDTSA